MKIEDVTFSVSGKKPHGILTLRAVSTRRGQRRVHPVCFPRRQPHDSRRRRLRRRLFRVDCAVVAGTDTAGKFPGAVERVACAGFSYNIARLKPHVKHASGILT